MTNFVCKKCGSTEYKIKDKSNGTGTAHGLYCAKCGFWHKWLGKEEKRLYEIKVGKQITNGKNTVTQQQIDKIIDNGKLETIKLGEKTTLVKFTTKEGFEIVETSACVDKANFNMSIGKEICLEHIKNKLWAYEGYCLQKELYKELEGKDD